VTLITRERIVATDPRLGRHINHDDRSRRYEFPTEGLTLVSIRHERHVPVFDQVDPTTGRSLGSCTGSAGIGCLATGGFYREWLRGNHWYSLDKAGAVRLYGDATQIDPYPGEYPPTDTGSDGLTIAKVLRSSGEIAGYQHTFSTAAAFAALTVTPFITGTYWYTAMFEPDVSGRVSPTGNIAGGHEYVADELDVENSRIWFSNSWGPGWGVGGRFWMSWDDYGQLLGQDGDVTVFTPWNRPAPEPADSPDVLFAAAAREWLASKGL